MKHMDKIMLYHGSSEIVEFPKIEDPQLRILRFETMTDEWLDLIGKCRGGHPTHQISFHSIRVLSCLSYERSEHINGQQEKG